MLNRAIIGQWQNWFIIPAMVTLPLMAWCAFRNYNRAKSAQTEQ